MPETVLALDQYGIESRGFRSRRLQPGLIDSADLILTAETRHADVVLSLNPGARDRTFPLLQFARLIDDPAHPGGPRPGHRMIERAVQARHNSQPATESEELLDPVGGPRRGYRSCAERVYRAIDAILGLD